MTRTQILYAWRDLAPHDDESTIDAILAMVDMLTGAKSGFRVVDADALDAIVDEVKRAANAASLAESEARDAEYYADIAMMGLKKLIEGKS